MNQFERFLKERLYLKNVSPRTIEWHEQSLKWLGVEEPTEEDLKNCVLCMREAGLKPSSVNCRLRSINAYLRWAGSPLKVPKLKEPSIILPVFSQEDIQRFVHWKPKSFYERRLQCLVLTLIDTGARISELLSLRWEDVDFDNLLVKLTGKGSRDRVIPFSIELRKHLFRFKHDHPLVFATRDGNGLSRRNCLRDVRRLCEELGVKPPTRLLHSLRRTYATHYIQTDGNVAMLQRLLGHCNITTTMVYVNVRTTDLSAAHQKHSLLWQRGL